MRANTNTRYSSYQSNPFMQLPRSMRDVYVTHEAWEILKRLASPFDARDVLQSSWEKATAANRVRIIQRDGSYAFRIVTRSTSTPVIAVLKPNRNPGRQSTWAITYLGPDTHGVLKR